MFRKIGIRFEGRFQVGVELSILSIFYPSRMVEFSWILIVPFFKIFARVEEISEHRYWRYPIEFLLIEKL